MDNQPLARTVSEGAALKVASQVPTTRLHSPMRRLGSGKDKEARALANLLHRDHHSDSVVVRDYETDRVVP